MTGPLPIEEVIEALENTYSGYESLDLLVLYHLGYFGTENTTAVYWNCDGYILVPPSYKDLPRVTTSVEAILEVAGLMFQAFRFGMYTRTSDGKAACLTMRDSEPVLGDSHARTLSLAICASLLKAILSDRENGK